MYLNEINNVATTVDPYLLHRSDGPITFFLYGLSSQGFIGDASSIDPLHLEGHLALFVI